MHNIEERDRQIGIKQAWHGLTEVVDVIDVHDNYLRNWDVVRKPLTYINSEEEEIETGFGILVGSDDDKIIGRPMNPTYRPVTNEAFIDLVAGAISQLPKATIESIGSVCNRGKVFATVSLKDHKEFTVGGRTFNDFLNFGNAHDQSSKLWINNTNTCTVCDNTFTSNMLSTKGKVASAVHRGDMEVKLADMAHVVDVFLESQEDFRRGFESLVKQQLSEERAQQLFVGFLTRNNPREGLSTRTLNKADNLTTLFKSGAGNRGENMADAFSAVTDYYTHSSTRGGGLNRLNQFVSSEFGIGRAAKQTFWDVVNSSEKTEQAIVRGEKLLTAV